MALPLIAAGLGAAGSLYQIGSGIAQGIKAKKLAKDYERQALENVYSKVGISTAAEEIASEAAARRFATQADIYGKLGVRGAGAISQAAAQEEESQRRVMASIDQKQKELQKAIADDEARIRGIREQRDVANIQGIGQLGAVGGQNIAGGLQNLASGAGQLAEADLAGLFSGGTVIPKTAPPEMMQSAGLGTPNIDSSALQLRF